METNAQQVCDELLALAYRLKSALAGLAEVHALTVVQFYTLHAISQQSATMGQLAQAMYCDISNITGIVDRLVAQGLAERREQAEDRRRKVLEITPKGRRLLASVQAALPERLGCTCLSATDAAHLNRLLRRLAV